MSRHGDQDGLQETRGGEERLRELFEKTSPEVSEDRLNRMLARAAAVPREAQRGSRPSGTGIPLLRWLAVAAALAAVVWFAVTSDGDRKTRGPADPAVALPSVPGDVTAMSDSLAQDLFGSLFASGWEEAEESLLAVSLFEADRFWDDEEPGVLSSLDMLHGPAEWEDEELMVEMYASFLSSDD